MKTEKYNTSHELAAMTRVALPLDNIALPSEEARQLRPLEIPSFVVLSRRARRGGRRAQSQDHR
jgi:hypothetical protein